MYIILLVVFLNTYILSCLGHISQNTEGNVDSCSRDQIEHIHPKQLPGKCNNFDTQPCLCELNGNCKYNELEKRCNQVLDCDLYKNEPLECKENHCFFDCGNGVCSSQEGIPHAQCSNDCQSMCFDVCTCKISGCNYNSLTGSCNDKKTTGCDLSLIRSTKCTIDNAVYVHNGGYCKVLKSLGDCSIEETVMAVNVNGEALIDSRGIEFVNGNSVDFEDKHNISIPFTSPLAQSVYRTGIYGAPNNRSTGRCVSYNISLCKEGWYELSIKILQLFNNEEGESTFNIKLGDRFIFQEFDTRVFSKGYLQPVELVKQFRVKNEMILVEGEDPIVVMKGNTSVSFCYGNCIFTEGTFVLNAFSVVKLAETSKNTKINVCNKYHGNIWDCHLASCVYNETDNLCYPRQVDNFCKVSSLCPECMRDNCTMLSNSACDCKASLLCEYNLETRTCVPNQKWCELNVTIDECRRLGDHVLYSKAGEICHGHHEFSKTCQIQKALFGINFFGPDHIDTVGVPYKNHVSIQGTPDFEDPYRSFEYYHHTARQIEGVPTADHPLYKDSMKVVEPVPYPTGDEDICVNLWMPTDGDGRYELSIKTGEFYYTHVKWRSANYKLNGEYIVTSFEPTQYRPHYWPIDLNVNFRILQNGTRLKVEGRSSLQTIRDDGKISWSVCRGACQNWTLPRNDINPHVCAISLVKLG